MELCEKAHEEDDEFEAARGDHTQTRLEGVGGRGAGWEISHQHTFDVLSTIATPSHSSY